MNIEKKAINNVGVKAIAEKINSIFFCNSLLAFSNLIWLTIKKIFFKNIKKIKYII